MVPIFLFNFLSFYFWREPESFAYSKISMATVAAVPSAASDANASLATTLGRILEQCTPAAATAFLASRSFDREQRRDLAELAGLEEVWRDCDQTIAGNVLDMASALVKELYEPFWFYRGSLLGGKSKQQPRRLFAERMATPPLKHQRKFWMASSGTRRWPWLPPLEEDGTACSGATFDAVVHFVQAGSGTGVSIGGGRVLTCAHVVDAREDDEDDCPERVGRKKLLMFASGRTFIAECAAVCETADGTKDVALLALGAELQVSSLPTLQTAATIAGAGTTAREAHAADSRAHGLPAAALADEAVSFGERLFCIGNPSNVDLESLTEGGTEFEPPTWHASVGRCEGYLDTAVQAEGETQRARKRPPTESEAVENSAKVCAPTGTYLQHSCWTYWGHSGAPLFNEQGRVSGLHCAWDDQTGMRHAQKLQHLVEVIAKADCSAALAHAAAAKGEAAKRSISGGHGRSTRKRWRA